MKKSLVWVAVCLASVVACSNGSGNKASDAGTTTPMDQDGAATDNGDGGFNPTCMGTGTSACGKPQSIVRVVAKLGQGMPDMKGNVVATLSAYRQGMGSMGGVWHTNATTKDAMIGANTTAEVVVDMCAGGEAFSEENCEYNLWVFVDKNVNGVVDQGEPAGHSIVNVSCNVPDMQCFGVVLNCTDGVSCIAFQDPGACACSMPSCMSAIQTCM